MTSRFLSGGDDVLAAIQDGSIAIVGATLAATNFAPNLPVKVDSLQRLYTTLLSASDVTGLPTSLTSLQNKTQNITEAKTSAGTTYMTGLLDGLNEVNATTLSMPQIGTTPTPPANVGWLYSDTSNELHYTTQGGGDVTLTGAAGAFLPLAGGTMSGAIAMGTNNITNVGTISGAANSRTADNIVSNAGAGVAGNVATFSGATGKIITDSGASLSQYLPLAGGTMSGNIAMGTHNLTGFTALTPTSGAVIIGGAASAGTDSVAIGAFVAAAGTDDVAIGNNASTTGAGALHQVAIGNGASTAASGGIAIGDGAISGSGSAIAIGPGAATASGLNAIAIGSGAIASATDAIAIGVGANNATTLSCLIGNSTIANIRANNDNVCDLGTGAARYHNLYLANSIQGSPVITLTNAVSLPLSTGVTGQLPLANGGTNANLTASNGGIFYSTASAGAILAGTATAGQMLQSGATAAPTWSTSTYPATNAINTLLYASAANVMSALATANSSVLVTSAGGVPSLSATLPSGLAATNLTLTTPALGTPSAGVLSSCTGYAQSALTGLGSGVSTWLGTPTTANLETALGQKLTLSKFGQNSATTQLTATTTETTLLSTGTGSLTYAANETNIGASIRFHLDIFSAASHAADTLTIRVKSGSAVYVSLVYTLPSLSNAAGEFDATVQIRSGSTGSGYSKLSWNGVSPVFSVGSDTWTISSSNTVDVTAQFSSNNAGNFIRCDNAYVETIMKTA